MQIEYDPDKDEINRRKHGVSLGEAAWFEWGTAHIEEDTRHDYGEQRFEATGYIGRRLHVVIFCFRGHARRIISVRKANPREEKRYATT